MTLRRSSRVSITPAITAVTVAKMMYSVRTASRWTTQRTEKTSGNGDDLQQHPESQVDDIVARRLVRRDGVRRRDHGHQADAGGGLQRHAQTDVQEGNEKDASADAEQRAEGSRHGTRTPCSRRW